VIGTPSPDDRSVALFTTLTDNALAARHLRELRQAMPAQVVYAADRMSGCSLDLAALPWDCRAEPEWMPVPGALRGRPPCWHKAEVAFLHAWRLMRPSAPAGLRWVWCTEYDVACDDWVWLEHTASTCDADLVGANLKITPHPSTPVGTMLLTCFRASVRLMDWLVEQAPANRGVFCERAVATAPVQAGFSWLDWLRIPGLSDLYSRQTLRPRPEVARVAGSAPRLWHPVKGKN